MEMVVANRLEEMIEFWFQPMASLVRELKMCDRYCNLKHMRYEWGRAFDLYEMEMELEREFTRQF